MRGWGRRRWIVVGGDGREEGWGWDRVGSWSSRLRRWFWSVADGGWGGGGGGGRCVAFCGVVGCGCEEGDRISLAGAG